jgi:non-ribosomal peptide synthetase component F
LHELFEAQVKSAPEKIALVCDQQQVTYGELNRRACHLAHYLRHCGVGPEQMIGIMSHRSVEMVVGLLGILKAGGAFVPLDAGYPPERLSFMLKDARISLLLTQRDLMAGLRLGVERLLYLDADEELLAQQSEENPDGGAQPDNPAYVIYTSGSTGRPKGVLIPHRSVVSYISTASVKFEIEPSDRFSNLPHSALMSAWRKFLPV